MVDKLKRRLFDINPGVATANWSIFLSSTGKFAIIWNDTAAPIGWRWNGTQYQQIGSALIPPAYFGEMTQDESYAICLMPSTTQRLQLRTVNPTTGEQIAVGGLTSTQITTLATARIKRIWGDYFLITPFRDSGYIYVVRINRADNTLTVTWSYNLTDNRFYYYSDFCPHPTKPGGIITQGYSATEYGIKILALNTTTEALIINGAEIRMAASPYSNVDVSDDGNRWYAQHPTDPTLNRIGTMNIDNRTATANGSTPAGLSSLWSGFVFSDKGILFPKTTTPGPYDRYQLHSAGVITPDTGAFDPMDQPTGPFSSVQGRRNYEKSFSKPRVFAFVTDRASNVSPGLYVYEEGVGNEKATLFAQGVMGDAFSSMQPNTTLNLRAEGLMGDAFSSMLVRESTLLFAQGIMGDATIRASDQSGILLAQGVMGDAWATAVVEESVRFSDYGLMGNAYSLIQVNDAYSFFGIGPIADAFAVMSDQNISFVAVAPMGDAFVRFSDERVTFFAAGPMGDAFSVINVDETTALFAQGVMGDAFALTDEDDFPVLFEAEGIMGDAFAITTGDFTTMIAMGIMGDAGIGMSIIPRGCRRRAMMVQNVI